MLNSFGECVRIARNQKKLSVRELAQRVGISTGHISNIENGKDVSIKLEALEKLQKELEFIPLMPDPDENMDDSYTYRLNKTNMQFHQLLKKNPDAAEYLLSSFEQGIDWFLKK